jgi:hypothetical protein
MSELTPWLALAVRGALEGFNPAMGWLFAVALGFQERRRDAVAWALLPIAAGHALAIALVATALGPAQLTLDPRRLDLLAALLLLAFGGYRLWRAMRPGQADWRVGFVALATWAFLAATGRGAGLLVVPALFALPAEVAAASASPLAPAAITSLVPGVASIAVYTVAMLVATGVVGVIVFQSVGAAFLRRLWVNLDVLWALALCGVGGLLIALPWLRGG